MSKTNKIFSAVPVKIPDRSGFDLSHEVLTTANVGTVVPITHFEVLPGDTISMGSMMKVTLPPFAVPFMGRVDAELTAAFIPYRLIWQGWQSFITQNAGVQNSGPAVVSGATPAGSDKLVPVSVPTINMLSSIYARSAHAETNQAALTKTQVGEKYYGAGSLADYLGYKRPSSTFNGNVSISDGSGSISALPFLAYHKFCDDWIRDENNMKPYFPKTVFPVSNNYVQPRLLPFMNSKAGYSDSNIDYRTTVIDPRMLYDEADAYGSAANLAAKYGDQCDVSICLGDLRQRCWSKDYFTTATTRPQAGAESTLMFETFTTLGEGATGEGSGGFTIAQLRAANSLQKWLERNNIAGTEYGSQILAHFGVTPPDAVLNRSVLLGSVRTPVVVNSVENNTGTGAESSGVPVGTKSPYGNVLGAAAGFGSGFDKGNLVDNFSPREHGIIMVFFTLIPHAYYNSGLKKSLHHKMVGDFAWPEFANIGDQPIRLQELTVNSTSVTPFGYNQRYSEYKFELDRISGLLADGNNLAPYALQRGFASAPDLGKAFLEIPTNYLDQVLGVSTSVGGFGCMIDAYFDCRALRVLPEYSLPSL